MSSSLHRLSLVRLAEEIRRGAISPVDAVRCMMDRIAAHDGALHAFAHLNDAALDQARRAEAEIAAGLVRGPLHGVPLAAIRAFVAAHGSRGAAAVAPPRSDSGPACVELRLEPTASKAKPPTPAVAQNGEERDDNLPAPLMERLAARSRKRSLSES